MQNIRFYSIGVTRIIILFALVGLLFVLGQIVSPQKAHASYEDGRLIDNSIFLDAKSMNASQIQSFLNGMSGKLKSKSFKMDCDAAGIGSKTKQLYQAAGAPCGSTIPASQIIYYASQIYGVNPKVILATLQKEQSLITNPSAADWEFNQAMGYNCPTSGSCNDESGFFWQIDNGTWVLRFHYERANGNNTWWTTSTGWTCGSSKPSYYTPNLYPGQNVKFIDPYSGIHYKTVFIQNAATSAFYCYTPHVFNNHNNSPHPNEPKGNVRCYSMHPASGDRGRCYTGSYNFVKSFENWFGPPNASVTVYTTQYSTVIDGNGAEATIGFSLSQKPLYEVVLVFNLSNAQLAGYSSGSNRITIKPENWNKPNANIVKIYGKNAPNPTTNITLNVSKIGSPDNNFAYINVNNIGKPMLVWQSQNSPVYRLYSASLNKHTFASRQNDIDSLTSKGYNLENPAYYVCNGGDATIVRLKKGDTFALEPQDSTRYKQLLSQGFVNDGAVSAYSTRAATVPVYRLYNSQLDNYIYTTNVSEYQHIITTYNYTGMGIAFKTCKQNFKPIFRLFHNNQGHFYTASVSERNNAMKIGYTYEGAAFYELASGSLNPVYRLFSPAKKAHFYTTSLAESNFAKKNGYLFEGVVFYVNNTPSGSSIYRLYSPSAGKHFLTTSTSEKNYAESKAAFKYEGIPFHISN